MSEELTPEQVGQLRERLERARDEVEASLAEATTDARPVDLDLSIGRLSRMDALQQQSMASARKARVEARQKQVQAAFARLEDGTYGLCVRCEEPIGWDRLNARPEAPLCRTCQGGR
jgi:DnaK suppressor protein